MTGSAAGAAGVGVARRGRHGTSERRSVILLEGKFAGAGGGESTFAVVAGG